MNVNDQRQHLAGRRHAGRTKEMLAADGENSLGKGLDYNMAYAIYLTQPSNESGGTSILPLKSTPATHAKQKTRSSSLNTEPKIVKTHKSTINREKPLELGTQTNDSPAAVQASHTAPLAQNATPAAFPAFELTAEEIAKPLDFVSAYGYTYVLVWECKLCNRWMPLSSKPAHLGCTAHIEQLSSEFVISSSAVAQNHSSMNVPVLMSDMTEMQPSNQMTDSPRSPLPTSQQDNNNKSQAGVQEKKLSRVSKPKSKPKPKPKSKPKPSKPSYTSDASQVLGVQKQQSSAKATSSKTESVPESTPRVWTCPHCRIMLAAHKRAAHNCIRSGPSIEAPKVGAIDLFFRSFPSFPYDARKSLDVSFKKLMAGLKKWHTWNRKYPDTWDDYKKEVHDKYQMALTHEFNLWFGTEDDIESWHALCRAVGIQPLPLTCEDCRLVSIKPHLCRLLR
jgi:hypothetical protein